MKRHFVVSALVLAAASALRADPIASELASQARVPPSKVGVSLGLGGGLTDFTGGDISDAVDTGGAWEVRATFGTRLFLAAEAAYVGSRRNLNLASVGGTSGETPHLFSHGVEGTLRAQYPYLTGKWLIEPFAFGGLGYTHFSVDGVVPSGSRVSTSDDVLVVPFGAGLSAAWNGLFVEGRFTYRATFNEDLIRDANDRVLSMANWSAGALIGYEF